MPTRRRVLALCTAGTGAALAGCSDSLQSTVRPPRNDDQEAELIDDWQYSPDENDDGLSTPFWGGTDDADVALEAADAAADADESIGLAVGGAADVSTFRRNVYEGYLPIPESMAYEGLFHDYYFDTGGDGSCSSLFCPTYTPAVTPDPLSGETERYLTVGLDSGLSQSEFERPALNLVIVLDISGSMTASFDDYYYDEFGNEQRAEGGTTRPKMDVARDVLVSLTKRLRPEDRLGVVLFNHDAAIAKPLRKIETTDMDAIRGHIQEDVRAGGGTNISAAMEAAEEVMADYDDSDAGAYENRSILLTDAQVNMGETDANELRDSLEENADRGHHTTVVGIGVDFNADLIGQLTAIPGANYYGVNSEDEFERRLGEEFEYMVTPLVYDLTLELESDGYEIAQVYGSTAADEASEARSASEESSGDEPRATGELMHVHTLFPSPRTDGEAKGGVVLVQLERTSSDPDATLTASWETRSGEEESTTETVSVPDGDEEYGNAAIRKAILLARYADLLKNWTIAERDEGIVDVDDSDGIEPPPDDGRLGQWELQSAPLTLSERYESRIGQFSEHFDEEASAIDDDDLARERELLDEILAAA